MKLTNVHKFQDLLNLILFGMRFIFFKSEMFERPGKCPASKLFEKKNVKIAQIKTSYKRCDHRATLSQNELDVAVDFSLNPLYTSRSV